MRVIAGTLRRRLLQAPEGLRTRPTSDRLRETLFNVLRSRMDGARFLDLYAGSGAVGIEAVSRGAAHVVLVERAASALNVLRTNLWNLGLQENLRVEPLSVGSFLRRGRPQGSGKQFDVVFLDPPYEAAEEYGLALGLLGGDASLLLAAGGVVIAEHRRKEKLEERYGVLARSRLLEQGDAALSFFAASSS